MKIKTFTVPVLQKMSSLKKTAEEQNLKFNQPQPPESEEDTVGMDDSVSVEICEEKEPDGPVPRRIVLRKSRRISNLMGSGNSTNEDEEREKIEAARKKLKEEEVKMAKIHDEEWKKIEAAKRELNEEKEKISKKKEEIVDEQAPADTVKKSSRKRKLSPEPERKEKTYKKSPKLRLKDFSTLAKESTEDEIKIIDISDEEDSKDDQAKERRDLKKFLRKIRKLLAKLNRKSQFPDVDDNLLSNLVSKFFIEAVKSYKMNNEISSSSVGISMTEDVKTEIVRKMDLFLEIRKYVEKELMKYRASEKNFSEKSSSLSLEFLHDIIESKIVFHRKLASKDVMLTADNKLWIANQVEWKMAQISS